MADKPNEGAAHGIRRFRVRGKLADGRQFLSPSICVVPDKLPPIVEAPPPPPPLVNPRWADSGKAAGAGASFAHGAPAPMHVDAPGLDGTKVHFIVEHLGPDGWQHLETVPAKVEKGVAKAVSTAVHPGQPVTPRGNAKGFRLGGARASIRFRVELA